MTKRIYKYKLVLAEHQKIKMPETARIVTLHIQAGMICLWAIVDPDEKEKERSFQLVATGENFPQQKDTNYVYIGTGHFSDLLVFHVFEVLDNKTDGNNRKPVFFWKDLSGRGWTNEFDMETLVNAFSQGEERNYDGQTIEDWLDTNPDIGETWSNAANEVTRTN